MSRRHKVCMLGAYAVGKTSLVQRYVSGIFSDQYLTTVGVKIDKHEVTIDGDTTTLVLWDIHGEDEFQSVRESYLRGGSAFLLVADGTRGPTLEVALDLEQRALAAMGDVPRVLLLNKHDLAADWELADERIAALQAEGRTVILSSAKTGMGVEPAFEELTRRLLAR